MPDINDVDAAGRDGMGDLLTPKAAGAALVSLAQENPRSIAPGHPLTAAGLREPG